MCRERPRAGSRIVSRYVIVQSLPWFVLALFGSVLVFIVTQVVRIAPLFMGHGAGITQPLRALALLVVPVVGWALTPALSIALFAVGGRMARDGELTLLDAAGFSRARLLTGPLGLCLVLSALGAWIWLDAAPRSQQVLRPLAVTLAEDSLFGQIVPGHFHRDLPGVTFFAEASLPDGGFGGVFLETTPQNGSRVQAVAKTARASRPPGQSATTLRLDHGTAFFYPDEDPGGNPVSLSFDHLHLRLTLTDAIEGRLEFLPRSQAVQSSRLLGPPPPGISSLEWELTLWRRIAAPIGALLLSALAALLAFTIRWPGQGLAVGLAALLFLAFHVLGRLSETLLYSGHLPAIMAALLPAAVVGLALVCLLLGPLLPRKTGPPPEET